MTEKVGPVHLVATGYQRPSSARRNSRPRSGRSWRFRACGYRTSAADEGSQRGVCISGLCRPRARLAVNRVDGEGEHPWMAYG
jgi:hypothetical protein